MKLLQIDFASPGPFGSAMSEAYQDLAQSIAQEEGLLWKIWTENAQTQRAGGWYAFDNEENLKSYLAMHTERLLSFGIDDIQYQIFDANVPLSLIDHVPLNLITP
jgi:hypothetical protein